MKSVFFSGPIETKEIEAAFHGEPSVLEVALQNAIELSHSCGGNATCGTCRVFVVGSVDHLEERNELEQEMADERGFQRDERLACQLSARPGLRLKIPG